MPPFETTSGVNPDNIYGVNSWRPSAWGRSWGISWGFAWGFIQDTPFLDTSGTSPDDIFNIGSGAGPSLYGETSGSNPDDIFEEN